jgi:hypothetical protein
LLAIRRRRPVPASRRLSDALSGRWMTQGTRSTPFPSRSRSIPFGWPAFAIVPRPVPPALTTIRAPISTGDRNNNLRWRDPDGVRCQHQYTRNQDWQEAACFLWPHTTGHTAGFGQLHRPQSASRVAPRRHQSTCFYEPITDFAEIHRGSLERRPTRMVASRAPQILYKPL